MTTCEPLTLPEKTEEFFRLYGNCVNWMDLFRNVSVPDDLIRQHHTETSWPVILRYQRLGPKLLQEFITALQDPSYPDSSDQPPPHSLWISPTDRWICWEYLSEYQILTPELVANAVPQLNWKWVTVNLRTWSYQSLASLDFLRQYHHLLDWNDISRFYPLTEADLLQVIEYVQFDSLLRLRFRNLNSNDTDYDTDYEDDYTDSDQEDSAINLAERFRERIVIQPINIYLSSDFIKRYRHRFLVFQRGHLGEQTDNGATTGYQAPLNFYQKKNINRGIRYLRVMFALNIFRAIWKRQAYAVGGSMYHRTATHYHTVSGTH